MSTDVPDDFQPEDATEVLVGREPPPFTQAPDWVGLADISPTARHLHTLLSAHINQKRSGKRIVWPSTRSLARMLNLSRRDKVAPFIAELVKIKAIDKKRTGMPARNVYVVHTMPPEGYDGPLSVAEWYERNRASLMAEMDADKATRDKRAAAKKRGSKEQQVTSVTADTGQQPVTADTGQHDTGVEGQHVAAPAGRKQDEGEPDEVEQDSEPASQVRPGGADAKVSQTTIDGAEEDLGPKEPTIKDRANEIARVWITHWANKGSPIVGPGPKVVHARMVSAVKGALEQGYSFEEVGQALNRINRNIIPAPNHLGTELAAGRGHVGPQQQRNGRGQGAMAGENLFIADLTPEQRRAQNPLRNAVCSSDFDREEVRA